MSNFYLMRKIKKLVTTILILLVVPLIGIAIYNATKDKPMILEMNEKVKDSNYQTTETKIKMSQQELENRKTIAEEYVKNISFSNDITLVKKFADYERLFDCTNYSNKITSFFTKKKISWLVEYQAILSIPFNKLKYSVNPDTLNVAVTYDTRDIQLLALEFTNVPTFAKDAAFLRSYSNEEIIAQLSIIKSELTENFLNEKNYKLAQTSLLKFILGNAIQNGNLSTIEVNGIPVDLTNEASNMSILIELNSLETQMLETQKMIDKSIKTYEASKNK